MRRQPIADTQWFSLSGRELLVLATGVGAAMVAVLLVQSVRHLWGHGRVDIEVSADAPVLPMRLDMNTAAEHELRLLPRIGPATAAAIVADRAARGPFENLDDLTRVKGIGPTTVETIRPHVMCFPGPLPQDETGD
jgi:competence ComEA-like helix-hairpin-helix protein